MAQFISLFYVGLIFVSFYQFCLGIVHHVHKPKLHDREWKIFNTTKGEYVFVRADSGIYNPINNIISVAYLLSVPVEKIEAGHVTIDRISDYLLAYLKRGDDAPNLNLKQWDPDENVRRVYQKALFLAPIKSFWMKTYSLKKYFNPSIVQWPQTPENGTLMAYRCNEYVPGFGNAWPTRLAFTWLMKDTFEPIANCENLNKSYVYLGLGPEVRLPINNDTYNRLQEDPRLLVLNNGSLLVAYNVVVKLDLDIHAERNIYWMYTIIDYDSAKKTAVFHESYRFEHPDERYRRNQKNWMPLQDRKGQMFFFITINPPHIVSIKSLDAQTNIAHVEDVVKKPEIQLPWDPVEYGRIRGGTAAVFIRGIYLSIFHTNLVPYAPYYKFHTYFMGAISFCPTFPFDIHAISRHPILDEFLYTGEWTHNWLDYTVYPSGIVLDDDGEHMYVSFGHQDRYAYIMKLHINELLNSMYFVSNCTSI